MQPIIRLLEKQQRRSSVQFKPVERHRSASIDYERHEGCFSLLLTYKRTFRIRPNFGHTAYVWQAVRLFAQLEPLNSKQASN